VLHAAVREALAAAGEEHADEENVRIIGSIAALLLCLAHADSAYTADEESVMRATLERVHGLDAAGVDAIATVLRAHALTITRPEATSYARELLELTAEDFRVELLAALIELAAADGVVSLAETNELRRITRALGLSQAQYNDLQARHRDKLAVLRG
jgi:uncharacterized tellurite resistance protein B-like protein